MRIFRAADVNAVVRMREAIDAVRRGFIALSSGQAAVPLRGVLETPAGTSTLTMPAHIHGEPYTVVKVVSVCPGNPAKGHPAIVGAVLVIDAATGEPLALMDGASLTALRTGAASGLATDLLARQDVHVLGVVGAGVQARTQIAAVRAVRDIRSIRIYSLEGAEALVRELAQDGIEARTAADAAGALRGADVAVAATTSSTPVIAAEHVAPGMHINGIGSFKPTMQEVGAEVVQRARVVVGSREGALAEAGDLVIPLRAGLIAEDDITEIGEIAASRAPGRTSPEEITFFKSVGSAVQDAAVAGLVYRMGAARGLGQEARL